MGIQVIKARKVAQAAAPAEQVTQEKKKRVAAYCRVSTDSEEQESSYKVQCAHYTQYITSKPEWELAGIYADEGISGTSTKNRERFNQMIADCEAGKIDMVITKSISRWARNTVDSLNNIRKLRDMGIPVFFEKENINTMDARGEVLITIMSSLAQQESDSISRNVRIGIQYHMQQGKRNFNANRLIGYTTDSATGEVSISKEGAKLVRRIYREYLSGYTTGMIAVRLTAEHIPTARGKEEWCAHAVESILKNEKYCGDFLMQKYYVKDFLSHKVVKNTGQFPQYFVENDHEPVVPKEVYLQVQGEMQRRSTMKTERVKTHGGCMMALSGKICCGLCGAKMKRFTSQYTGVTDWRCRERDYERKARGVESHTKCRCRNVPESEVKAAIVEAFNRIPGERDSLLMQQGALRDGEMKRIDQSLLSLRKQKERLDGRMEALEESANETAGSERTFLAGEIGRLVQEEESLVLERAEAANREVRTRMLLELADLMRDAGKGEAGKADEELPDACTDYDDFFRRTRYTPEEGVISADGKIMAYSDDMVVRFIDKVTVTDDGYKVLFRTGLEITVRTEDLKKDPAGDTRDKIETAIATE